jgi:hypothetical protein
MMKHLAFLLLLSLAAVKDGSAETALRAKTPSYSASHQRRELSVGDWWYTLLNLLHVPCGPHHSEEHPHGHCAHHSHHPPKKSGGSHSSSSSSSSGSAYCQYTCDDCDGSSSDCSCHKCSDVCQETCDGSSSSCVLCESVPECSDDCVENDGSGCVSCSSGYSPDGWTGDEWTGDGTTTETTSSSWGGDAWQASYSKQNDGSSGSGKAAFWGIGAGLCALVAGAALFMTRVSYHPSYEPYSFDRP